MDDKINIFTGVDYSKDGDVLSCSSGYKDKDGVLHIVDIKHGNEAAAFVYWVQLGQATEKLERCRAALLFYASAATYDANEALDKQCSGGVRPDIFLIDPIKNDKGEKARAVLAESE